MTPDEKDKSADELIVEDLKTRSYSPPDQTGLIVGLWLYNIGPFLSIFSVPLYILIALIGRKRKTLVFDTIHILTYQTIGIGIILLFWLLWSTLFAILLVIFGNEGGISSVLRWSLNLLAIAPSMVAVLWLGYAVVLANHPKRILKLKRIYYPKITEMVEKVIHNRRLQQFHSRKDYQGEGGYLFLLGSLYLQLEEYDKAQKYAKQAIQIYQSNNDMIRETGALELLFIVYKLMKNPVFMIETLCELASKCRFANLDKKYEEVISEIVELTNNECEKQDFLEKLNSMLLEKPVNPVICFCRANVYESRSEFDVAYEDAMLGLSISPDDPNLLSLLGIILYDKEQFQKSIEILSKAIQIKSDWAYLYRYRAECYLELQNLADATVDIDETIKLGSRTAKNRAAQALLFLTQKDYIKAERYFQIAVNQQESIRSRFGLTMSKLGQNDLESAHQTFLDNYEKAKKTDLEFIRRWIKRVDVKFDTNDEKYELLLSMIEKSFANDRQ